MIQCRLSRSQLITFAAASSRLSGQSESGNPISSAISNFGAGRLATINPMAPSFPLRTAGSFCCHQRRCKRHRRRRRRRRRWHVAIDAIEAGLAQCRRCRRRARSERVSDLINCERMRKTKSLLKYTERIWKNNYSILYDWSILQIMCLSFGGGVLQRASANSQMIPGLAAQAATDWSGPHCPQKVLLLLVLAVPLLLEWLTEELNQRIRT